MSTTHSHPGGLGHRLRKRRAKLRSWWYGTPDKEKALTFMGWGIALVAIAATAWFVVL